MAKVRADHKIGEITFEEEQNRLEVVIGFEQLINKRIEELLRQLLSIEEKAERLFSEEKPTGATEGKIDNQGVSPKPTTKKPAIKPRGQKK
jgi:hypothetical protein